MRSSGRVLVVDDNPQVADVVRALLTRQGLEVALAHSATEAEQAYIRERPDAVVTDLLLPDLTGQRLLARLRTRGRLPPVFIMTGVFRGPDHRAQLAGAAPVAGWFEKPFDHRALAKAVCEAVGRTYRDAVERAAAVAVAGETENTEVAPRSDLSSDLRSYVRSYFSSDPFRDARTGFGLSATPSAADMTERLRTKFRAGDLRSLPMPWLLGAFNVAGATGDVAFGNGAHKQLVYFERGRPVFTVSNRVEDGVGKAISEALDVDVRELGRATQHARATNQALTTVLVERGLVDAAAVARVVRRHTRRLLFDLFRWTAGRYIIRFRSRPDLPQVDLVEDTGILVMEGVRERMTADRLRGLVSSELRPSPSPNAPFSWSSLPLHDAEAALLLRVTGARTVRQLVEQSAAQLDERRVLAVLYGLLALGVLVCGRSTVAPTPAVAG